MNYNLIVACAGKGERVGLDYNKLFYKGKDGLMMIEKTLELFLKDKRCTRIILAINEQEKDYFSFLANVLKVKFVLGGKTREESVYNAIKLLEENIEYCLIHDGDRPYVSQKIIDNVLYALEEKHLSVIPCIYSRDATIYKKEYTTEPIYFVQTPQGFNSKLIKKAFEDKEVDLFRDEGSLVAKKCGIFPHIVEGDPSNIKITFKEDLERMG